MSFIWVYAPYHKSYSLGAKSRVTRCHKSYPKNNKKTGIYITANDKIRRIVESYGIDPEENHNLVYTEFYDVEPNLSFKNFNLYINSLDNKRSL